MAPSGHQLTHEERRKRELVYLLLPAVLLTSLTVSVGSQRVRRVRRQAAGPALDPWSQ